MKGNSWEVHKVSSSQTGESKQGKTKMNLAIISQCPVLASTPQAIFLPKTLSTVSAHHLQVRFCCSNRRGQECVGWVRAAVSAGWGHQKGHGSL